MNANKITISTSNSKLGVAIPTVNLPPITTCRKNAPCYKYCYARKGNFRFSNVEKSLQHNLEVYETDAESYFNQIKYYLLSLPYKYFRYHSSGDIVDMQYLDYMCKVARAVKKTSFLCFTKKYELVNEYISLGHKIPRNLTIVFSNWGSFQCENPYKLPTTWVKFKDSSIESYIPKNAIECSGHCASCQLCWKLKSKQAVYFNQH